jgi:hypothetical protein
MKTNPFFSGIIFIALSIGAIFIYDMTHPSELTIEQAMEPVKHLTNARQAIKNKQFERSLRELDEAILDIRTIETSADSSATPYIERAIEDLALVKAEIKNDTIIIDDLDHAFFNSLNSIAYANLTISEKNLDKGEVYKAIRFMNATFKEMVSSLKFAHNERDKAREEEVIKDIKSILTNLQRSGYEYRFSYDSLNREVEELIEN